MQPTDKPTVPPTHRPTSEMAPVVKLENGEPISLIIIIVAALVLCTIFVCFMWWLSITKRIPRFSVSESYRTKNKKKSSKNKRYETESESEYEVRKKKHKQSNRIELYVQTRRTSDSVSSPVNVTYQGGASIPWSKGRVDDRLITPLETESSITEGNSIRELKNAPPIYVNELDQMSSRPKLLWSAISRSAPSNSIPEESSDSEHSVSPLADSLVLQDPPVPSPIIILEEIHGSPVKNALSEFLTPRDTMDSQDSEFINARETRQVSSRVLFSPKNKKNIDEPLIVGFSSSEYSKEGENSNSDGHDQSIITDLPKQISLLEIDRNFTTGGDGEKNSISIKYKPRTSPGEDMMRRKTSGGLSSLGIADSYNAEPIWKDGEAAEDHYVFGNAFQPASWAYETKDADAELDKARGGH